MNNPHTTNCLSWFQLVNIQAEVAVDGTIQVESPAGVFVELSAEEVQLRAAQFLEMRHQEGFQTLLGYRNPKQVL